MREWLDTEPWQQAELVERLMMPQPVVIGIEGGPCSGKTTLIDELKEQAQTLERPFVSLPEAATMHIQQLPKGVMVPDLAVNNRPRYLELQKAILRTTVDGIRDASNQYANQDAIIVADRVDIGAYVTRNEYRTLYKALAFDSPPMHSLVDRLVYLPSVAVEKPELYAKLVGTNAARHETSAQQAAATCVANLRAVQTHPELHIAWGGEFSAKIKRLAGAILQPEIESEIKFAVPKSDGWTFVNQAMQRGDLLNTIAITQSYHQVEGWEFRLRRSTNRDDGVKHYHFTSKTGEGAERHELQREISRDAYYSLARTERAGNVLRKLRHVVLASADGNDEPGLRRLWFADLYVHPQLDDWHFETDVEDQAEYDKLAAAYPTRQVLTTGAKALALA